MYAIVKAIGIKFGVNKRWELLDLNEYKVIDLYKTFRKCFIELSNGTPAVINCLNIQTVSLEYSLYAGTFKELLESIGNKALPTIEKMPTIQTRVAKYRDAFQAGYNATPVHHLYNTNVAPENLTSVLLTRDKPVIDYNNFYKHCLVSINGFYHLTDTNKVNGVMVYDAYKSLKISNQNQIGIYSFEGVCDLEFIPITRNMIHKQNPSEKLSSSAYIHIDKDLTNKSIMLVMGGYLHSVDSDLFKKVGLSDFKIDFKNYNLLDKYFESKNYIDLKSLNLSMTSRNLTQVSIEELFSDECIKAYLTISQSFFVIMDNPDIFTNKIYVKKSNLYGMYISYIEPKYPLKIGLGRHPEYLSRLEDGQYAINVQDNTIQNKIYNTVNPLSLNSVSNSNTSANPDQIAGACFLEIGKDI